MIETGLRHQIEAQLAHPWAFRLPGSLDALYEAKLGADRRCGLCLTLLVAAAAVGAVGILNWVNEPAMFAQSWLPRLAVTFLLILGAASMRSARRGWPEGLSFGVPIVATTMLIVWIGGEGPVSFADRSSIVALLVLACVCAVSPLPLLTADLVAIGGFAGLAWMRHHVLWKLHGGGNATLLVFGAVALSVALLMARHREVARRRGFLCAARDALNAEELMRMNAELQLLMDTDVLTGVCNRRRFEADLNARWPYRDTSGLGLLLIDVDHFKRFNDEAGHAEGDKCLRDIACAIAGVVRGGSFTMARWGGEEFVVLAPGILQTEVASLCERVRAAVLALDLPHPAAPACRVTVSVGGAWCGPGSPCDTPDNLLRRADGAMYAAKAGGRNRVVLGGAGNVVALRSATGVP